MVNPIEIDPKILYSFKGGLKLKQHKSDSLDNGLNISSLPDKLYISLRINKGNSAKPVVAVGDKILKGQIIAKPDTANGSYVHASSSGEVTAISEKQTASPDADIATVIEITTDKQDKWCKLDKTPKIDDAIKKSGLVGMGGAGFPTHLKYSNPSITTLIINGAECEPYISCDEQMMINYPDELVDGISLLMQVSGAKQAVIALEDQVGRIKSHFEKLIINKGISNIVVIKVPTIYPAGGEKQLIKVLTGKEVPSGRLPLDMGIIVQNVATVKAFADFYRHGRPLVERIITVAGDGIDTPQNFIAAIGTPIRHLLKLANFDEEHTTKLIIGGPMMGYAMPNNAIGIDKTSNCILALTTENTQHHGPVLPCIRCGECVNVCPAHLLPQQLHWYIKGGNYETARQHHLFDCIECGACAWVCPSQIKLVDYYRYAKSELKYLDYKRKKSDLSQIRHEQRDERLERIKQERVAKRKRTKRRTKNPEKMKSDLQATLDRVKKTKEQKSE